MDISSGWMLIRRLLCTAKSEPALTRLLYPPSSWRLYLRRWWWCRKCFLFCFFFSSDSMLTGSSVTESFLSASSSAIACSSSTGPSVDGLWPPVCNSHYSVPLTVIYKTVKTSNDNFTQRFYCTKSLTLYKREQSVPQLTI